VIVDWQVNIGWGPPMLIIGSLLVLPMSFVAGLPWLAFRSWQAWSSRQMQ